MNMQDVMTRAVVTCHPFDKLFDAASTLQRENVGCLPVVSDDASERVLGLLTDHAIAMAAGRDRRALVEMYARSAMTGAVLWRAANRSLSDALAFMHSTGARRLPVVDRDGRLIGLLSLGDVVLGFASTTDVSAAQWRSEFCRILAASALTGKRRASHAKRTASVDEIMVEDVVVCRRNETLGAVARRMDRTGVPCTPVLEAGSGRRVVAMLTARDICLEAVRRGRPLDEISVEQAMSPVLRSCWPDDSPEAATAIMRAFGVRRLPVVDPSFELWGLITLGSLARTFLAQETLPGDALSGVEIAETLAAILRVADRRAPRRRASGDFPQHVAL
jgi:CBS domain-containing protein